MGKVRSVGSRNAIPRSDSLFFNPVPGPQQIKALSVELPAAFKGVNQCYCTFQFTSLAIAFDGMLSSFLIARQWPLFSRSGHHQATKSCAIRNTSAYQGRVQALMQLAEMGWLPVPWVSSVAMLSKAEMTRRLQNNSHLHHHAYSISTSFKPTQRYSLRHHNTALQPELLRLNEPHVL